MFAMFENGDSAAHVCTSSPDPAALLGHVRCRFFLFVGSARQLLAELRVYLIELRGVLEANGDFADFRLR